MDFMQRGTHQAQSSAAGVPGAVDGGGHRGRRNAGMSWQRLGAVLLLFASTILIVALLISLVTNGNVKEESKYINNKELQAVFLNGGQVYFGNITALNNKYLTVDNIYYLRVNQTVQPNGNTSQNSDVSLVKLGCELHGPEDQMVINRDQVVFWENLKSSGQVAKAVAQYVKQNPNGQNCNTTTSSTTPTTNSSTGR